MKLATIALFAAVLIGLALGTSSLLQYNSQDISTLLNVVLPTTPPVPQQAQQPAQQPVQQPGKEIPVPSGTFTGPTGQPTIKGPTGPPPQE